MYELVFWGAATVRAYSIPRHRRMHRTIESAREAARNVRIRLDEKVPVVSAAHPAIVYGPGLGNDGITV